MCHLNKILTWLVPSVSWHGCYVTESRKGTAEIWAFDTLQDPLSESVLKEPLAASPSSLSLLRVSRIIPNEDAGAQGGTSHGSRAASWVGGGHNCL